MMVQFTKQAKSNQEHLQTWQDRGLIIPDLARADRYLSFIGYYRLSAYTIPFQQIVTTPSTVYINLKLIPHLMMYSIYISLIEN
jgi:abortive infection bacteriophage resistance protein